MAENSIADVNLTFPADGYTFDTQTEIQKEFISKICTCGTDDAIRWLLPYKENTELTYPRALRFEWQANGSAQYYFELSKDPDFSDSLSIFTTENHFEADNLEIGQKYFWRVNKGNARRFYTKNNGFRFIRLDGALNVRDIGGNKIKQGLIYRGSDIYTNYRLSPDGINTLVNVLKVKTELELRAEYRPDEWLDIGDSIRLVHLPYRPYKEIFEDQHRKGICEIMNFLSCEENYPIYVHCLGGADRTGMIAFFLRAIAGENDEFILADYELTSLSSYAYGLTEGVGRTGVRNRNSEYFREFLRGINEYAPEKTFKEKITNFLLDCGVSRETLDKIVCILT